MSTTGGGPGAARPARRDAVRNRTAILAAADRLVSVVGTGVSVAEVAAAAGVAVGTVYRHWSDKTDLLASVLNRRLSALVTEAERSDDLRSFIDTVTQACVADRSLPELVDQVHALPPRPLAEEDAVRGGFETALEALIGNDRERGLLRHEVTPGDIRIYLVGIRAALASADESAWRRHHAIYTSGLFGDPPRRLR